MLLSPNMNPKKVINTKLTFTETHSQLQNFLDTHNQEANDPNSFSSSSSSIESLSLSLN